MTEKERLVGFLDEAVLNSDDNYGMPNTEQCADYLLANGVKIPVRCEECVLRNNCIPGDSMMICGIKEGYCAAGKRRTDNA